MTVNCREVPRSARSGASATGAGMAAAGDQLRRHLMSFLYHQCCASVTPGDTRKREGGVSLRHD